MRTADAYDTATAAKTLPDNRLAVINGLRGVAIAQVIAQHILTGMFAPSALTLSMLGVSFSVSPLVTNGWTGVNLFFILSGFVLFLPYAGGKRSMHMTNDRLAFYRRRCRRLLPLFFIAVVAAWALALVRGVPTGFGDLLSVLSLTYIVNADTFGPSFNIALWSVGVEIAFSAMFPLLVLALRRWGIWRFATIIVVLALVARLAGILHSPALQGPTMNSDTIICRLDEFAIGMVLAERFILGSLPRCAWLYTILGMMLVGLAWIGFDLVLRGMLAPIARAGLNDVLDAGLVAIVIAALTPETKIAYALAWPPLQVVGMMCYSLYLWHWPLLHWLAPDRAVMTQAALITALCAFVGVTFILSALTYRFIEFPSVRDWRQLFLLVPMHKRLDGRRDNFAPSA